MNYNMNADIYEQIAWELECRKLTPYPRTVRQTYHLLRNEATSRHLRLTPPVVVEKIRTLTQSWRTRMPLDTNTNQAISPEKLAAALTSDAALSELSKESGMSVAELTALAEGYTKKLSDEISSINVV